MTIDDAALVVRQAKEIAGLKSTINALHRGPKSAECRVKVFYRKKLVADIGLALVAPVKTSQPNHEKINPTPRAGARRPGRHD